MNTDSYAAFGAEIDAVRRRVESEIGEADVRYIRRITWLSRGLEILGRGLIHFSVEPIAWSLGVLSLAVHKQLHGSEIGHTILHGAFDKLPGAERYRSKGYWWETPIDEQCWHEGHNIRHHQYTNIVGKDPDCRYGAIRLNEHVPHEPVHRHQVWHALYVWPTLGFSMAANFAGLVDVYARTPEHYEVLPDDSRPAIRRAHWRWARKAVPYYAKEYLLFPLLAGPMFWKVALGNFVASTIQNIYSAATIFCGHVGVQTAAFPEGTRATSRGQWYAMQVEGANDFEVPLPVSILCGALDKQIEHHLFPRWPTPRLRQAAPEIAAICKRHGVRYRSTSWPRALQNVFRQLRRLQRPVEA